MQKTILFPFCACSEYVTVSRDQQICPTQITSDIHLFFLAFAHSTFFSLVLGVVVRCVFGPLDYYVIFFLVQVVFVSMYLCICICVCALVFVFVSVHLYLYLRLCTCICICVCPFYLYLRLSICICICVLLIFVSGHSTSVGHCTILRNSASIIHWLSSSIFNVCCLFVRPASVTHPLISTI